jgi:hypothetical protein
LNLNSASATIGFQSEVAMNTLQARPSPVAGSMERRALLLWPRLDRAALRRCNDDPDRITALVARRTTLPPDAIRSVLVMSSVTDDETATWFG